MLQKSSKRYRFGDGREMFADESAVVPIFLGSIETTLKVDVVDAKIPLLLSKESLKKGEARINFVDNTICILGQTLNLKESESGHLLMCLYSDLEYNQCNKVQRVLVSTSFSQSDMMGNKKKVVKLHRQFCHPPPERLKQILKTNVF